MSEPHELWATENAAGGLHSCAKSSHAPSARASSGAGFTRGALTGTAPTEPAMSSRVEVWAQTSPKETPPSSSKDQTR